MIAQTKNFKPETDPRLACSHTGKFGVQQWALDKMQLIRDEFGEPIKINSSFRDFSHPVEARKGHKRGRHPKGVAFDIDARGWTAYKKARFVDIARKHGALGVGIENGMIHIDFDEDRKKECPRGIGFAFWGY